MPLKTVVKDRPKKAKSKPQSVLVPASAWDRLAASPVFAKGYVVFAVVLLLATTVFWALQSARLQLSNADQLVNPYLLEHSKTFREALFPGAHSFLLKWPLFWLIRSLGFTTSAYLSVTVGVVLLTVGGLAFAMYRIERRPLVFGTLCLALASTLLAVPAQPYAGALLPVNMAMLTTRNLEYILYIFSLYLFVRSPRFRSWRFWVAVGCLGLLIANDKLFLIMSIGGALLALIVYALNRGWKMVGLSARWVVAGVVAAAGAAGLLWMIQFHRLTHFSSQSGAGPYNVIDSVHSAVLGAIYAVLGLLTNFGANPVYNVTILRNIPHQLLVRLWSPYGVVFIINGAILLFGLYLTWRVLYYSLTHHKRENSRLDTSTTLSVLLIWTSFAAVASFVATNHYYAVDARYLSISLFAVFITAAAALSQRQWQPKKVLIVALVLFVSILAGLLSANHTYNNERSALSNIDSRNTTVAQALVNRRSEVLVGNYWRVIPIKFIARSQINVMPLEGCTQPRSALSSQAWQPNLNKHGFVYLLSLDSSQTDYPHCSLNQIITAYGRPNASALIAGSLSKPRELLLFYDNGIQKSAPLTKPMPQGPSTVVPVALSQLTPTPCDVPTVMTVVAHQDDDLLFMNPGLIHDIKAGYCMRTVYVTAGDAGNGKLYWLGREQGSEAAYSNMLGIDDIWIERIVQMPNHEYVTVANPQANPNITLVFMHLPDGNLKGEGFKATNYESLARLEAGEISIIHGVDGQSSYTSDQLISALTNFMHFFQPSEINTQSNFVGQKYADHSDHMAVGRYVQHAYQLYEQQQYENTVTIPLDFYIGYPIHQMPANVFGDDLQAKEAAFLAYAKFDGAVCSSLQKCIGSPAYGAYLTRQYQNPN